MTTNEDQGGTDDQRADAEETPQHPEQEHPVQDAHGGSMAPGLVDDTGHAVGQAPQAAAGE